MTKLNKPILCWGFVLFMWIAPAAFGQPVINEILFNPPGGTDSPNEYIELRGAPNMVLPPGTFLVAVEGDTNGIPGTIQNTFDLSGRAIGGNGFLVLLQKGHPYTVHSNATVLVNTNNGAGWGSGSSSSLRHRGENSQTDLENPSVTFFLIQTTNTPNISDTIDSDTNGTPDGPAFASWTIYDSVGVLDADGFGDFAYGAINFRRNTSPGNTAGAIGIVVPVGFTPSYVGRAGNSTGSLATAWVASDGLGGVVPNWLLGNSASTAPPGSAGAGLNHIGGPNFGAPPFPGVVVMQSGGSTDVNEGSGTDSYTVGLNTVPSGAVSIQITAGGQTQVSIDNGATFASTRTLSFTTTNPRTVLVRALDDNVVDTSPHPGTISHAISSSADPTRYPLNTEIPKVIANIVENDFVLLSELKVNPPGADEPNEFVELKGISGTLLTNIYFLGIEGNIGNNPGTANLVVNLSSARLGSSGLLLIVGNGHPYVIPDGTTVITDAKLSAAGGALGNGTISFLLVSSPLPIAQGTDLDGGDNGKLEGLPAGTTVLDAVGWSDGNTNDIVYGGVMLTQTNGTPDAATRFSYNNIPRTAAAWFNGDLAGMAGATLNYDADNVGANFPTGTPLTPGVFNNAPPSFRGLQPFSSVIGDPTNPDVFFTVNDAETDPSGLTVTASSSNPSVVPSANLILNSFGGGSRSLTINPVGVGYATITLSVSDDDLTVQASFPYAASAPGRPGGYFLTGVSDASTAIPIDANWMFVADDENQIIRIYSRVGSGAAVQGFNFTPNLGLTDIENGFPREVDIEASTRVNNRLFWMGGHSHANVAETRTNRSRVFATDMAGTGLNATLTYVGRYDYLKLDLVNWDMGNGHGKGANYYGLAASTVEGADPKATNGSGFNIEGLAMAPGSTTTAFVACRAPIAPAANRTFALIVPVLNFAALAASDGPPGSAVFGPPIELDLYGRGIRSIEGNATGYLIIGGPPGDFPGSYPTDFRLYTWTGNPADNPQQRAADLIGLNPEGIVELPPAPWTAASQVQLISDSGRTVFYNDDVIAKHLPVPNFKKFRSDVVALGGIVKPTPVIRSLQMSGQNVTVTWRALRGESYRVRHKSALSGAVWADLQGDVVATGPYASKVVSFTGSTQQFYQVMVLP